MPIDKNDGFNLYNFRQVIGDPARPYLFLVHIPEIGQDTTMTAIARSTELPPYTLGEVPVAFQGMNIKLATPPTYGDWSVTFLCDEAHELRRLFFKWQSIAYDAGTMLLGHSQSYKSDNIGVSQLARNGERVAKYGFVGMYPKTVGNISVGHDQTGNVETFEVAFAYDYWVLVDQMGTQTTQDSFVRSTQSVKIDRGVPPPGGNWQTPFKPQ